jgi:ribulose 1,5-bisphosphate synthetase/thiazole synthase
MKMEYAKQPAARVPIVADVDVVVAGAGIAGLFAALGAAKCGAKVALVDRFGAPGGNIGPAMLVGGPLYEEVNMTLHDGQLAGIAREFMPRVEEALGGMHRNRVTLSHAVSRVALDMLGMAGVQVILSAYAADPIVRRNRVIGLFVEAKSGRIAIRAKVVVDDTGDAEVAARAGAPIIRGSTVGEIESPNVQPMYKQPQYGMFNDGGIYFILDNADISEYRTFCKSGLEAGPDDKRWAESAMGAAIAATWPAPMIPLLRRGWESGEFCCWRELRPNVHALFNNWFEQITPVTAGGRAHILGEYDTGNWADVALMEREVRAIAFDGIQFFRKHVPGFKECYLLGMSAYLGARGGPCIEGAHVLTPQESFAGAKMPDTMFVSFVEVHRGADKSGHDMPYGMLLPKGVEGLLVTGRGASFLRRGHDPSTRARCNMMLLGQATGMAAALAAARGVTPRKLNIRKFQRALLAEGYYLGEAARLKELHLI